MINQVTVEALHSANYVENYLDSVENLPDDVQRYLSRIREFDVLYRNQLRDVSVYYEQWNNLIASAGQMNGSGGAASDSSAAAAAEPSAASKRAMARIQQGLIAAQELGDEKLQIVQQLQDMIDHKTRQLDQDFKNLGSDFFSRLDYGRDTEKLTEGQPKEIRSNSPGSACSPNNVNSSPVVYSAVAGNGQSAGSSGSNGGNGAAANATNTNYPSNNGSSNNNGNSGNGSSGNNGGGAGGNSSSERGSKRARRTRNEQTSGSANGSSTPNSTSGSHVAMELDPIDTSNVKQEMGSSSGSGQVSAGAGSGSGSGSKGNVGQSNSSGQGGKKGGAGSGKKKKRKTGRGQARETREDTPPPEEAIDPDEPTYCLCDQISFGEMILCDNDLCPIEWFHFSCVALMSKPKGKWFCPNCRGDRPNVMKPKAQFLKELERYNKEKEEKT